MTEASRRVGKLNWTARLKPYGIIADALYRKNENKFKLRLVVADWDGSGACAFVYTANDIPIYSCKKLTQYPAVKIFEDFAQGKPENPAITRSLSKMLNGWTFHFHGYGKKIMAEAGRAEGGGRIDVEDAASSFFHIINANEGEDKKHFVQEYTARLAALAPKVGGKEK